MRNAGRGFALLLSLVLVFIGNSNSFAEIGQILGSKVGATVRKESGLAHGAKSIKTPAFRYRTSKYRGWWSAKQLADRRVIRLRNAIEHHDLLALATTLQAGSGGEEPGGGPTNSGGPGSGSGGFGFGGGGGGGGNGSGGGGPALGGGLNGALNPSTGNQFSQVPLFSWPCRGNTGVSFTLFHNSYNDDYGVLGYGWSHSYEMRVQESGTTAIVKFPNGLEAPFELQSDGTWLHPKGLYMGLLETNDLFTLVTKEATQYHFNADGHLTSISDRYNNTIHVLRDSSNRVTEIYGDDDATARRRLEFEYDGSDLIAVYQKNGYQPQGEITFELANNHLETIQYEALGASIVYRGFTYDSWHNILSESDYDGNLFSWTYTNNKVTSAANANGKTETYAYDNPVENGVTFDRVWVADFVGQSVAYTYSGFLLVKYTDKAGYETTYGYDAAHNLITVDSPDSTATGRRIQSITYDNFGNPLSVTNDAGSVTTITWRPDNQPAQIDFPVSTNQLPISYEYNASNGLLFKVKRGTGSSAVTVASFAYDQYGQVTDVYDGLNRRTRIGYDAYQRGDVTSIILPCEINSSGQMVDPIEITSAYSFGYPIEVRVNGVIKSTYQYNRWHQCKTITNSAGHFSAITYDNSGRITSVKDALGRVSTWNYDFAGRLLGFTNPKGESTTYTYNANDWVVGITNALGITQSLEYTVRGELKKLTCPQSVVTNSVEEWTYNPDGSLATDTKPAIGTITLDYDGLGQLTSIHYPNDPDPAFSYDALGRLTGLTDSVGTSSWTFNTVGELTQFVSPQGTVAYDYSLAGELTTLTDVLPGGNQSIYYEYGAATGRLKKITSPQNEETTFEYDPQGQPAKIKLPHGIDEVYGYDSLDRLTNIDVKLRSTSVVLHWQDYTYNAGGEVVTHNVNGVQSQYGYDLNSQLTSEVTAGITTAYTYDSNGNRLTRTVNGMGETYAYDLGDKLLSVTSGSNVRTFAYDALGRVISDLLGRSFTWNDDSRLTLLDQAGGSDPTFAYNAFGTRVSRTLSGANETWKRVGPENTSAVLSDSGATYVPAVSERRSGVTTFSHSDLKNEVAQSSNGSLTATRTYDAFGAVLSSTGSWMGTHGYAGSFGYQEDSESGLKLLGNRYYDPSIGRFITQDAIKDGPNWYTYCGNNPVQFADPSGNMRAILWHVPTYVYKLFDDMGNLMKIGVTWNMNKRYTQTFLVDRGLVMSLVKTHPNRAEALVHERQLVETIGGPMNREPWSASRRKSSCILPIISVDNVRAVVEDLDPTPVSMTKQVVKYAVDEYIDPYVERSVSNRFRNIEKIASEAFN